MAYMMLREKVSLPIALAALPNAKRRKERGEKLKTFGMS